MKKQLLTSIVITLMLSVTLQAQTFTGSYQLIGVNVVYTNIARLTDSPDDSIAQYTLDGHWPSTASSAFSLTLAGWAPGDTIAVIATPDILLTPFGLDYVGIDLNLGLNQEDGQMLIPGVEGTTSTYPTTDTEDCSTFAVIAPVTDNAVITYSTTSNSYNSDAGTFTWGFGMSQSDVFDWFDAPDDWEDPTASATNYGILTGSFNDDNTGFDEMELIWHAVDGQDSDSGIDAAGLLNRHLGVTLAPSDTVTVAALAAQGIPVNVGTYPILGGTGVDLDGDGVADGVVNSDWGYIFDPLGADGIPFWLQPGADDSPFQFTGYYFTYNGLAAISAIMTAAGDDANGDGVPDNIMALIVGYMQAGYDQATATLMALDDVAQAAFVGFAMAFGVDETTATAAAAAVGAYAQATYAALVAAGDPDALNNTAQATAFYALGVLASLGIDVDDSAYDYIPGANGRLVFQIGNSCVPDYQERDVLALFEVIEVAGVESEDFLPAKFAVYENYPNPFNPVTKISFDLTVQSATEVTVWNLLGQKVSTLFAGDLSAGHHTVTFDGHNANGSLLPSGVYIYRVESGSNVATKKMMLLK
jgi:hypothetical protein